MKHAYDRQSIYISTDIHTVDQYDEISTQYPILVENMPLTLADLI